MSRIVYHVATISKFATWRTLVLAKICRAEGESTFHAKICRAEGESMSQNLPRSFWHEVKHASNVKLLALHLDPWTTTCLMLNGSVWGDASMILCGT
jgi:hypothetical protein